MTSTDAAQPIFVTHLAVVQHCFGNRISLVEASFTGGFEDFVAHETACFHPLVKFYAARRPTAEDPDPPVRGRVTVRRWSDLVDSPLAVPAVEEFLTVRHYQSQPIVPQPVGGGVVIIL
jgi:hypothetical protein